MHRLSVLIFSCAMLTVFAAAQELPVISEHPPADTLAKQPATPPFELARLRTDRSRSYLNRDGTVNSRISAGMLQNRITPVATADITDAKSLATLFPDTIDNPRYVYRFNADTPQVGYRVERDGCYIEFNPTGDWDGITVTITPGTAGIKEEVTFTEDASRSVSWIITTDGVMTKHDGVLHFTDTTDMVRFAVNRADAFDAEMKPVEVITTVEDSQLTYTILPDTNTVWPVILDPSVTTTSMLDGRIEAPSEPVYADSRDATAGAN